uniref:NADH dehydrogenase subunit 3 n=1 Tax=Opisthoteuthis massyae TaxID=164543 RepID=UPI0022FD9D35|nr:NADH dehydrogenase subunit 3 [Opisthoteuthis massyae]WAP91462.1 NADH dehydrogenase subunit 3 [Opisthoteuthis massyae]WAP91488.1 NADH dehydrogenase subunit 3 [Opisthoteuthis massyae]
MIMIMLFMMFLFFLNCILLSINILISKSSQKDREKSSPFECGFDTSSNTRSPFSMRFFLLAVIFLVFDIEIILLIPISINMINSPSTDQVSSTMIFLMILLFGLIHEWNQGSLNWL